MLPDEGLQNGALPVQGEVVRYEVSSELSGQVLGSEGREGGAGCWEACGGGVISWRGAGDSQACSSSFVAAVGNDGGEASLSRQDGGWCRVEGVGGPPLDPVPEAVHAPEGAVVGRVEVGPISLNGSSRPWAMRWHR